MFESKKFLALLVTLVLVGTVGGAFIAIKFLRPKTDRAGLSAPVAQQPPVTPAAQPAPAAQAEPAPANVQEPAPQAVVVDIAPDFHIMTRKEWRAHSAVGEMKPQTPKAITIHHTAVRRNTKMNFADKLRGLQSYAQHAGPKNPQGDTKAGWPDITSHYYIDCKGEIAEGADVNYAADFKETYDTVGQISISVEGNFEEEDPTPEQMESLGKLVGWLSKKYSIPSNQIKTHHDYAATVCPGKNLESKLQVIREASLR